MLSHTWEIFSSPSWNQSLKAQIPPSRLHSSKEAPNPALRVQSQHSLQSLRRGSNPNLEAPIPAFEAPNPDSQRQFELQGSNPGFKGFKSALSGLKSGLSSRKLVLGSRICPHRLQICTCRLQITQLRPQASQPSNHSFQASQGSFLPSQATN